MKHILEIARKDILQTLRDRLSFLFLLVMPVAFTLLFGFAFGGLGGKPDPRPLVGFTDRDNSPSSRELKGQLLAANTVRLEDAIVPEADLAKQVADGKMAAALVVPSGFGAAWQAGESARLVLYSDLSGSAGQAAQAEITRAARRLWNAVQAARALGQDGNEAYAGNLEWAAVAWREPPLRLELSGKQAAGTGMSIAHTAPGMMIQFAIAGLLTAAQVLVSERKSRCMQRLLTTAVARHEILLGHFLAIFAVILAQLFLLVAFGQVFLKLDYLRQPLAVLVMMLATALFVAALGLLIGALAKTNDQAILYSLIPMFVLSGLGGAWAPLETTGKAFQFIGHLTPVAWAMDGFKNILLRGLDISSVWLPAAALLGYAVLLAGLAVWKFRFE